MLKDGQTNQYLLTEWGGVGHEERYVRERKVPGGLSITSFGTLHKHETWNDSALSVILRAIWIVIDSIYSSVTIPFSISDCATEEEAMLSSFCSSQRPVAFVDVMQADPTTWNDGFWWI